MIKFLLKEDLILNVGGFKHKLLDKDTEFSPNNNGLYEVTIGSETKLFTKEEMELNDQFKIVLPPEEDLPEMRIEEIIDGDDDIIKSWRIVLDVKTSRNKLKKIEKFINDNIKSLLKK